ncbi:NERD domain-containing protein [Halobacillus fulvus]|nr:NERD domain-containing protein [Halobacillus fulvus]
MAQLIKLQDYISRYESDIYQYPSQFIRLKKENWKKMKHLYDQRVLDETATEEEEEKVVPGPFWKRVFRKESTAFELNEEPARVSNLPVNEEELKQYFLNGLFPFQLKWASGTLREKSFINPSYQEDSFLKYLLQRFPDTFFVMYQSIVEMKKAHMEILPIMIGPHGIDIIYYFEEGGRVFTPSSEKAWHVDGEEKKIVSPIIALNRSETFVKSVFRAYFIDLPIRKVILAPESSIKNSYPPYQTEYIDKDQYPDWFKSKRNTSAPLKHQQLKAADTLLKHCVTTSFKRPEWEEEEATEE